MSYRIIYLDPPWRFKNWSMEQMTKYGEKWARRNGRSPYPVMSLEDQAKMPIGKLGSKHSIMLMWTTYPKIEDGLWLLKQYGYTYKTIAFTWVKQNPSGIGWHVGLGYHTRQNPEIVLLGTKGKGVKRVSANVQNLLIWPRGEHSRKPPIVRNRIEELYGNVPRIEIYARSNIDGWDSWGNQCIRSEKAAELLDDYLIPPYDTWADEDEYLGMPPSEEVIEYNPGDQMFLRI